MILVTGPTGNVGSEVVKQLATAGHRVRALAKDEATARRQLPTNVDIVRGDLSDRASIELALRGVEKVYLLAPLTPDLVRLERNVIDAAKRTGVRHIVKHSVIGAQYEGIALGRWHRAGEKEIEASGIAWTFIRPTAFASNALAWAASIKQSGSVYSPAGDGKLAVVDPRDVAAVAVKTLVEPGHEARGYDITGGQALSTKEQVEIVGRTIGRTLTYVPVPDSAARDAMLGQGIPLPVVDVLIEFMALVRAGNASIVTETVQRMTGRAPRTFEAWIKDHASAFRG